MATPPITSPERVVVVGGGAAGLATALYLAPTPVTVLTSAPLLAGAATAWAQGGLAAALGDDDDPALHAEDTLRAGVGLGDPAVAARVAAAAPARVRDLIAWGAAFDRTADGALALGLEAAHARRRIVRAGGDATGRAVLAALVAAVRGAPSVAVVEDARATDLVLDDGGAVAGVAVERAGVPSVLPARAVVLATGGIGGLYAATTNPLGSTGSGLAPAVRAGAALRDTEFVQFHPTALALGADPMPLATEAIRGEGAHLIDDRGERFMADVPDAELAPRDVVARAVWAKIAAGGRVFLDAREALGTRFAERFPTVAATCRTAGLDPARRPIPVAPAAHYHMGGIAVDGRGRSTLPGLWACGEVAATGLHGANRLASNALVEALAYARWIAEDVSGVEAGRRRLVPSARPAEAEAVRADAAAVDELRRLMTERVGVVRDAAGLKAAIVRLQPFARGRGVSARLRDRAVVGLLIAEAALARRESLGAHCRRDFAAPEPAPRAAAPKSLMPAEA